MDPQKKARRPAGDYLSQALDPAGQGAVNKAGQQLADGYFRRPGGRVPNNPQNARISGAPVVQENSYRDWRVLNEGAAQQPVLVKPSDPSAALSQNTAPMPAYEQLSDQQFAFQVTGSRTGGEKPPPLVLDPGISKTVARDKKTGAPVGGPLQFPQVSVNAASWQEPLPPTGYSEFSRETVKGQPRDARLPRVGEQR